MHNWLPKFRMNVIFKFLKLVFLFIFTAIRGKGRRIHNRLLIVLRLSTPCSESIQIPLRHSVENNPSTLTFPEIARIFQAKGLSPALRPLSLTLSLSFLHIFDFYHYYYLYFHLYYFLGWSARWLHYG